MIGYDALMDVQLFNNTAGNEPSSDLVDVYMNLIKEEYLEELLPAYERGDRKEMLDGAGDLIVVAAGLLIALGVDPNAVMKEINTSNLSKFCKTEEDAQRSVDSYQHDTRYVRVCYKKVGELYVIFGKKVENPDGGWKILKGIDYFEPDLAAM